MPINWCTSCKCGLANEEVVDGVCERCGSQVVRKVKSQWMLKITAYAQKLLDGLDDVDFIERVKIQQRNWIGRSERRGGGLHGHHRRTRSCGSTPPGPTPCSARPTWSSRPEHPLIEKCKADNLPTLTRSWPTGPRPPRKSRLRAHRAEQGQDRRAASTA